MNTNPEGKGSQKDRKRKKGAFYSKEAKKAKLTDQQRNIKFGLTPGLRGFLISCDQNEGLVIREAYELLNEYADQIYGPEVNE